MSELTGKTIYLVKSEEDDGDMFYTSVLAGFSDEGLAQTYRAKELLNSTHSNRIYIEPLELDAKMNDEPMYVAWSQFTNSTTDLNQVEIFVSIEDIRPTLPSPKIVRTVTHDTYIGITTYAWSEAEARRQMHEIFAELQASGELADG